MRLQYFFLASACFHPATTCCISFFRSSAPFIAGSKNTKNNHLLESLRTFAQIVCAERYCAGKATVICHALLRALVKLRF